MYTIDNVYELIQLLKKLNEITGRNTRWKGKIILIPVILEDLYYLGTDLSMVYKAHLGKGENLRGSFFKEFVPEFWNYKPNILLTDEVWLFNTCGSEPFNNRYTISKDKELLKRIDKNIEDFIKNSKIKVKDFELSLKNSRNSISLWKKCSICNPLPDSSYAYWKGNELESGRIGCNEKYLEIIGAPTFTDSTSYRHWCIKRCPQCNTYYFWKFNYEYYVNGTEDEITLKRLDEKEVPKWLKKVEIALKLSKK